MAQFRKRTPTKLCVCGHTATAVCLRCHRKAIRKLEELVLSLQEEVRLLTAGIDFRDEVVAVQLEQKSNEEASGARRTA